jgi:hypothetical protein
MSTIYIVCMYDRERINYRVGVPNKSEPHWVGDLTMSQGYNRITFSMSILVPACEDGSGSCWGLCSYLCTRLSDKTARVHEDSRMRGVQEGPMKEDSWKASLYGVRRFESAALPEKEWRHGSGTPGTFPTVIGNWKVWQGHSVGELWWRFFGWHLMLEFVNRIS